MGLQNKKKKALMLGVTTAFCVGLLMSGTFAWTSLNQKALNEVTGSMNSGGRLHDDFKGSNKDIYVENYTSAPGTSLIVRVRLREYMELKDGSGTVKFQSNTAQSKASKDTWDVYKLCKTSGTLTTTGNSSTDDKQDHFGYAQWTFGGKKVYLPTFNKDDSSEKADINGVTRGDDTAVEADYKTYSVGQTVSGTADYGSGDSRNGTETHSAEETLNAKVMSMASWNALNPSQQIGAYWVFDTDGWAYWAQPLRSGTATGLLLDQLSVVVPEDLEVYYGIYVESQMVTAGETDKLNTDATEDGKDLIEKIKGEIGTGSVLNTDEEEEPDTTDLFEEDDLTKEIVTVPTDTKEPTEETPKDGEAAKDDQAPAEGDDLTKPDGGTTKEDEDKPASDPETDTKPDDTTPSTTPSTDDKNTDGDKTDTDDKDDTEATDTPADDHDDQTTPSADPAETAKAVASRVRKRS